MIVAPQMAFDARRGFGFLHIAAAPGKPAVFALAVDEGNYDVTIRFGDPADATATTIKAESRRLMVERVEHFPVHDVFQLLEVDHKARPPIDRTRHRNFERVVVSVPVRVIAFAKKTRVLFRRECRIVIVVRRREFGFASEVDHGFA